MSNLKSFIDHKVSLYEAGIGAICSYFLIDFLKRYLYPKQKILKNSKNNANITVVTNTSADNKDVKSNDAITSNSGQSADTQPSANNQDEEDDDEEDYSPYADGEIRNNYGMFDAPFKMMLCVNMSLNMGKGKIGAQCGHATLGAYKISLKRAPSALKYWNTFGQAKICVKIENDELMHDLEAIARASGLVTYIVEDAGRTQIAAGLSC